LAYALAGADCIDVAADMAVVKAAKEGLGAAQRVALEEDSKYAGYNRPWLMASMSAGADPHFRKAWFDAAICPADCPRPCERVCPADAIAQEGVIRDRCYGCGRCLPICPLGLIEARSHPTTLDALAQQVLSEVDALEIHTHVGSLDDFEKLWQTVRPWISHLKLISISCPDAPGLLDYLRAVQAIMAGPQSRDSSEFPRFLVMWQTDGRPMSGDIGKGTTHAAIRLAQKVLASNVEGYVQLAGGTNQHTALKLSTLNMLKTHPIEGCSDSQSMERYIAGVAYGSYARSLLMPIIEQTLYLEEDPPTLWKAVALANSLVRPLKRVVLSK